MDSFETLKLACLASAKIEALEKTLVSDENRTTYRSHLQDAIDQYIRLLKSSPASDQLSGPIAYLQSCRPK